MHLVQELNVGTVTTHYQPSSTIDLQFNNFTVVFIREGVFLTGK